MGKLKQKWREFKQGQPGRRFQKRYERNKDERQEKPWYWRFFKLAISVVLIALGVLFIILPGPGVPFLIVGAGLLADFSLTLARVLDWTELKVRQLFRAILSWWKQASAPARGSAIGLGVLATSAMGYFVYRIMS